MRLPKSAGSLALAACCFAAACSAPVSAPAPETWQEAEHGFEQNCMESTAEGGLTEAEAVAVCVCLYDGFRTVLLLDEFLIVDRILHEDSPPSSEPGGLPVAAVEAVVQVMEDCSQIEPWGMPSPS